MECSEAKDLLPQYLGRSLSNAKTVELMAHLSLCETCREELKFLLLVEASVCSMTADVPEYILKSAFRKVEPHKDNKPRQNNSLTIREAFGVIGDILSISCKAIKLAFQILQ